MKIKPSSVGLLAVFAIALLGSLAVARAADPYPWGGSDSVAYIDSARNLMRGNGLGMQMASGRFAPLTHFPPLYSLLLAAAGAAGADLLIAARWIDIVLFAAIILLASAIGWAATRSGFVAVVVGMLVATSPRLLTSFSSALSEPPFMVLMLLSLGLAIAASRTGKPTHLAASALAASLATLTRYAGIGLIPAGAATVALLSPGNVRSRLGRAGLFLGIALLPLVSWALLQRLAQGGELPRALELEPGNLWEQLGPFRGDLATWGWYLIPGSDAHLSASWQVRLVSIGLVLAGPIATVAFLVLRSRAWRDDPTQAGLVRLVVAGSLQTLGFLGGLGLAYLVVRPRPDIESRMVLPLQIPVWLVLIGTTLLVSQRLGARRLGLLAVLGMALTLTLAQVPKASETVEDLRANPVGYLTPGIRDSGMIAELRSLPASTRIISNESALVLLWVDRPAYDLPEVLPEASSRTVFRRFGDEPDEPLESLFREGDVVLAVFQTIHSQFESLYGDRGADRTASLVEGLKVIYEGPEGAIYSYPR